MFGHVQLTDWTTLAAEARGEGMPLTRGIIDEATLNPILARRGLARATVSLAAGKQIWTSFDRGSSHADVRDRRVNIDEGLLSASETAGNNLELPFGLESEEEMIAEVLAGVSAHEGAHQRYTEPHREPSPLLRFLVNLVEDERIERLLVRDFPVYAGPLAVARDRLITADELSGLFAAIYIVVRAPARTPPRLWRRHQTVLLSVIEILSPFPETYDDVLQAAIRISRLIPQNLVEDAPPFPEFGSQLEKRGKRPRTGRFRRWGRGRDELEDPEPKVSWIEAKSGSASAYLEYQQATAPLARAIHAVFQPPYDVRYRPSSSGRVNRKRLSRHRFDERILRHAVAHRDPLELVLLLDLSGSMRGTRWDAQHRIAVAFFEAVRMNPALSLRVYGHGADAEDRPSTQIYRLATSGVRGGGPATCLGDLPEGSNNRDGHSLRLIGQELASRHPVRRGGRLVIHASDASPSAAGYGGQPALGATRDALTWFRKHVAPIGQIGIDPEEDMSLFGAPFIVWDEAKAESLLRRLTRSMGAA